MKLDYNKTQQFLSQKFAGSQAFLDNILSPIFSNYEWVSSENRSELDEEEELRPLAEQIGIEEVLQVGYFEHEEEIEPFYLFDITVRDSVQMSRNRVGVQRIIRRILDDFSHAFMLFHYEDTDRWDWRFSYCHKGGTNEVDSDAKRYTYLLGPGQTCRTATQRFVDLSKNETLSLKAIQDAFNVEALSDEFFNKYREHYADIVQYITGKRYVKQSGKWVEKKLNEPCEEIYSQFRDNFAAPEKTVRDYIKKLMGRLVFLQFLQKKGWLGVPADRTDWIGGDPEFLQNSWNNYEDKVHFIDNFLEPLFSDLDTKRKNDIASKAVGTGIKIPYLNGGLFELGQEDIIEIPMPEEYIGGILQFFSEYNFTIDENDPNDAQVGVDPEMLGRIFENLLEDNKDKGAYYTPKPIVKYMCTESLIAYLKTGLEDNEKAIRDFVKEHEVESLPTEICETIREKLRNVKICDPAIGSGAFPVGLLNELFLCLGALETFKNPAEIKKHIIQNSIYGVDIEKGAVDIARLRFWLSIVVDEPTPETLPNLDFKIMQGNSLLEQYQGYDLSKLTSLDTVIEMADGKPVSTTLFGSEVDTKRIELRNLLKEYYSLSDKYEKDHKRDEIKVCVEEQLKADNTNLNLQDIDVAGNDQFFLWHTWFSDVFNRPSDCSGFDIVIGNPPYVEAKKLKYIASTLKEKFTVYTGTADLSIYFNELGLNLLAEKGIISYITTNKFFNTGYGEKIRRQLSSLHINIILNFEQVEVFEDVLVSSVIFNVSKKKKVPKNIFTYEKFYKLKYQEFNRQFVERQNKLGVYPQDYLNEGEWSFSDIRQLILKEKIEKENLLLKDIEGVKIYRGVTTGYNPAFIISNGLRNKLMTEDSSNAKIIKKLLQGRNIRKWYYNDNEDYLLQTGYDIDIENNYPTIYKHLLQFENELIARADQGINWYNLRACKYYNEFEKPEKIIWGLTADKWAYTLDTQQHYLPSNAYILTSETIPIKFILGLLNSKLLHYYFGFIGVMTAGGAYTLKAATIEALPIAIGTNEQQKEIAAKVESILIVKAKDKQKDVSSIEREIDHLVYNLYGLSEDDIKIVESN